MSEFRIPWLALVVLAPTIGALCVGRLRNPNSARKLSIAFSSVTLAFALGAWLDFASLGAFEAHDRWDILSQFFGREVFVIDTVSAPLLSLTSLLYVLTLVATVRTKVKRFSFSWSLAREAALLATLCSRQPWVIVGLLAAGTIQPWVELRSRGKPTRVYVLHMATFVVFLVAGQLFVTLGGDGRHPPIVGILLLMMAVLVRSGAAPFHCWMTDLFERATFGTSLLFVTPMVGAYAAVRLVIPIAPEWALRSIALVSLATAVYAAGMALVQREARRFFCYLFLSHSSLVLVGMEIATPIGLAGALSLWLSVAMSLAGFGLTLRAVEARQGRLSLSEFHGLYSHAPMLAAFFLLTGLASIGFPGTVGFVGMELLVEGAVQVSPVVGAAVVVAAALNSLAVLHAYMRVFTGARHASTIDLRSRLPERIAVLTLTLLILGGGLVPQPGVASRYHAAVELVEARKRGLAASEGSPGNQSLAAARRFDEAQKRQAAARAVSFQSSID